MRIPGKIKLTQFPKPPITLPFSISNYERYKSDCQRNGREGEIGRHTGGVALFATIFPLVLYCHLKSLKHDPLSTEPLFNLMLLLRKSVERFNDAGFLWPNDLRERDEGKIPDIHQVALTHHKNVCSFKIVQCRVV